MYKIIRKYQKPLLAIFGVLLMVIFIIPSAFKGSGGPEDHVVAYIGQEPIYNSEKDVADREWQTLSRLPGPGMTPQGEPESLAMSLGTSLVQQIEQHPELFLLLQKEATKEGVVVSDATVNTYLQAELLTSPTDQSPEANSRRQAIRAFLLVSRLYGQLIDGVKYTKPMWAHLLAQRAQKAKLTLVTLKADQFKASVPAPKMDDLRKQYDRLSHVIPVPSDAGPDNPFVTPPPADDPLGFGYELPRRVKLQTIEITRKSLLDQVAKSKSNYDWEVDARKYFYSHEADFPTTLPGTNPATQPTTRPYGEVRQLILDQIRSPDADVLGAKIKQAILTRLNADYAEYAATTQPTTRQGEIGPAAPSNRVAGLGTQHYLDQLASDMQKQFGVLPIIRGISEWESASELNAELAIGQAKAPDRTTFAEYAIGSDDSAGASKNLHVLEPTTWLSDDSDNNYLFRLTAVAPAAPAKFDDVQAAVSADWITQQAYDKAVAEAKTMADKSQKKLLASAAVQMGYPAFTTDYFNPQRESMDRSSTEGVKGLGAVVDLKAQGQVIDETQTLLGLASTDDPHPVGLIKAPQLRSVIVVQLIGVQSSIPSETLWRNQISQFSQRSQGLAHELVKDYFSYDAVVKRLGYKPAPEVKKS